MSTCAAVPERLANLELDLLTSSTKPECQANLDVSAQNQIKQPAPLNILLLLLVAPEGVLCFDALDVNSITIAEAHRRVTCRL
jgi:hypothetical protein